MKKYLLIFEKFNKNKYEEYLSWFQDPELNRQLGPMKENDEWFKNLEKDESNINYSVFIKDELVAVIGIGFPDKDHPSYYITNLAIRPDLRGRGIGRQLIEDIRNIYPLKPNQSWRAFVDITNPKAKQFFENNGWLCLSQPPENNDIFLFEFK